MNDEEQNKELDKSELKEENNDFNNLTKKGNL